MIYGHFQSTGGYDTAQGLSVLLFAYNMMASKISIQDGIGQNLETSEMPPEMVPEGLYRNRLQVSEQLQTVFAMYNQDLSRDRVAPSQKNGKTLISR